PSHAVELSDARARDWSAFRHEQSALEDLVAAVPAKAPAGGDHAVAWHVGPIAASHDIPHGPPGTRPPGERRDVAVRRHAPRWNPPHDVEDARRKAVGSRFHRSTAAGDDVAGRGAVSASRRTRPGAFG